MLTLIIGRAGTGKTSYVMNDIKRRMDAGEYGLLLIVPEQYSHDAERQLNAVCGDKLSLHGETLSFTRLCSRVFSEAGRAPQRVLDEGGQMLVMHRALEAVASKLRIYGKTGMRAELIKKLLDTVRELKSLSMSPESLERTAARASQPLAEKLRDLALILGAYDAGLRVHGADASDRLSLLTELIGESSVGENGRIYFDGFNDFTAQELGVVRELFRKNAEITICLTLDADDVDTGGEGVSEVFELPRRTAVELIRIADACGVAVATMSLTGAPDKSPELIFLEHNLFGYDAVNYPGRCESIELYAAPSKSVECEYAAYRTWELVRSGYRWRDVGVMARNWDDYGAVCENVFEKYGVPFFSGGRESITDKAPVAFIDASLEIATSGFEYKQIFRYLKTGLSGVQYDDCSELENYAIKWQIRRSQWASNWKLPPPGYGDSDVESALERLNALRRGIVEPLLRLRDGIKGVSGATVKIRALYSFLEDVGLPERLDGKTALFQKRGEQRLADEYAQLWSAVKSAMENSYSILGDAPISALEFRKLFMLTLSGCDVGVIPVSLDRTALGGMAMNRRRDLKCLIVLGATDENMPTPAGSVGMLSDSERDELAQLGADLRSNREDRLLREMNMLYSVLTLPSRKLVATYPVNGGRPSFIVKRIKAMFSAAESTLREEEYMSCAPAPCFELAALAGNTNYSPMAAAARVYFAGGTEEERTRLAAADSMTGAERGRLSAGAAEALYGPELSLSPSRVNRYYSCPFAHFLYSGLRLAPRLVSSFDAPEAGTFMHYVLEGVSREIMESTGFRGADDETYRELTSRYIGKYAHEVLLDFEGKNARYIYLFRRLEENTQRVVSDMLDELRRSEFEPLSFELDLSEILADKAHLRGVIDRVDGWSRDGKQYLRVIDYKTGRKSFDLTDVLHGRDMQMLIYLFALMEHGSEIYGAEAAPSGILYVPARDVTLKAGRNTADEELAKLRERELRRSGLILDDAGIIEAMESGEEKRYLPVKRLKDGAIGGESLISIRQTGTLSRHVDGMMRRAAGEILDGTIECSPYYKSGADNACLYCEYHSVCGFDEETSGKRRYIPKLKADEVWAEMERAAAGP